MTKVLLFTESWGAGGIEGFILDAIRGLSNHFSFSVYSTWESADTGREFFESRGISRYTGFAGQSPSLFKRYAEGPRRFEQLLNSNDFDVVHFNLMNGFGLKYCEVAKQCGIKKVIAHSHNSAFGPGATALKSLLHGYGKKAYGDAPDVRLGCSEEAGRFLFGADGFRVLHNGVDVAKFAFRESRRIEKRKELGIKESCFCLGSIGRIEYAKNPLFQLSVFSELQKMMPSSRFLMVGEGSLGTEVEREILKLGLSDSVIRLPYMYDPETFYSCVDALLLPSFFEGLPRTSIEAQCCGLPVFRSDTLTSEIDVTPLVHAMSLQSSPADWALAISEISAKSSFRGNFAPALEGTTFSMASMHETLNDIYSGRIFS